MSSDKTPNAPLTEIALQTSDFLNQTGAQQAIVTTLTKMTLGEVEIFMLRLKPQHKLDYQAGQYVEVQFGALAPRPYSIANAPYEDSIEIHVKRAEGEASHFIASILKVGDIVNISAAKGDAILHHHPERPLLIVAGGMGFTPAKAVIESILYSPHKSSDATRPITFFWGTRTENEQYLRAYFEDCAARYDHFKYISVIGFDISSPIFALYQDLSTFEIYVAGPPMMIEALLPQFLAHGAQADAIIYDNQTPHQPLIGAQTPKS
jgi:CDP-4-dehydro-6-deoxyglucose reductase